MYQKLFFCLDQVILRIVMREGVTDCAAKTSSLLSVTSCWGHRFPKSLGEKIEISFLKRTSSSGFRIVAYLDTPRQIVKPVFSSQDRLNSYTTQLQTAHNIKCSKDMNNIIVQVNNCPTGFELQYYLTKTTTVNRHSLFSSVRVLVVLYWVL